jgi:hypothetical protein
MKLDRLTVVHARKRAGHPPPAYRGGRDAGRFFIETCLRLIWIDPDAADDLSGLAERTGGEVLRGQDAYRLLLEIGCGLHSAIPGEAEVFGQIRSFWKRFYATAPAHARRFEPLMQRLLEDIKDIRTRHLQGLGGATYGSLARLLLDEDLHRPTLLVGAGKMARAVAPYLSGRPLYLWNRTAERLDDLMTALGPNPQQTAGIHRLPADPAAELAAWRQAETVVLCVPPDTAADRARLAAWQAAQTRGRIVHLGVLSTEGTAWTAVQSLSTLQDLFALRDARNELRTAPLARARATCAERARLRTLGGPPTLAHGWEDLPFTLTA